jgi:hypothetical protein
MDVTITSEAGHIRMGSAWDRLVVARRKGQWTREHPFRGKRPAIMNEKPYLILGGAGKNVPMTFNCSVCGEAFALPKRQSPEEAVTELWSVFTEHVRQKHPTASS